MPNRKPSLSFPPDVHSALTTSTNGHSRQYSKLAQLLDYHERVVSAIKTTIELLYADDHADAQARHSRTIRSAMVLDSIRTGSDRPEPATRTPKRKPAKPHAPARRAWKSATKRRRAATAALLATFDLNTPRPLRKIGKAGILIQHGYLARSGDGYVRTSKEFVV